MNRLADGDALEVIAAFAHRGQHFSAENALRNRQLVRKIVVEPSAPGFETVRPAEGHERRPVEVRDGFDFAHPAERACAQKLAGEDRLRLIPVTSGVGRLDAL